MEIKKLNHNTIDVFIGTGWEQWGRFKIAYKQEGVKLYQVSGNKFPKEALESLEHAYN